MAEAGSAFISVRPDLRGFHESVKRDLRGLAPSMVSIGKQWGRALTEGIRSSLQPVRVRLDTGRTAQQLVTLNRALDRLDGRSIDLDINVEVSGAVAELAQLEGILDRIDGRTVQVDVDTGGAARALRGVGDSASSAGGGVGVLGRAMSLLRLPAMALGAASAAAGVAQLAVQLAPLAGLAAGLPAVIGGVAIAFGTLKLATAGVGEAFGAALSADAEKFQESLKGLAPAARSVAVELRGLRPQLLGIRTAAQQALFAPLTGQLRATVKVLSGPLKSGVRGVAAEFGLAGRSVLQFARSTAAVRTLRALFDSVAASVRRLRPAIQPVLAGFAALATDGAGWLERLSSGIANVATRFGEWMQAFAESGGVDRALSAAVGLLKQIGGLLSNIGGIFQSVFQAASASGGGLFGILGQLTGQLNTFLKTAAAQQALRAFFDAISQIGRTLAPIVPILGHVIAQLVNALHPVILALLPIVSLLIGAFGRIVRSLTPILAPLGAVIASLLTGLLPILTPMVDLIAQTAEQIGGALVAALTASLPSLQQLVLSIASLLPELMPLIPLWAQWLVTILPLVPVLLRLAATLVGYLVPVIRVVIQVVVKIWTTIAGFVIPIFQRMVQVITWVAGLVQPILSGIWVAIKTLGRWALWLWEHAIQPAFRFIATLAKWLYSIIVVVVVGPIIVAFKILAAIAKWLWKSVLKPAFEGIGKIIGWVWKTLIRPALSAIWGFLRDRLGPVFQWIYRSVIKPVWDAVGSAIRWVWDNVIKRAFNAVRSGVEKLAGYFRNAVKAIGRAWDGLKSAAKKPVAFVVNTVYNGGIVRIWNAVADLVPGVGELKPVKGFARGGVVPAEAYGALAGYTPGRDSLIAAVSPGEAWMRPEWTRAIGPRMINLWNDIARREGPSGVRKWFTGRDAMGGEGINFARGGVVPGFAGRFGLGGIVGGFLKGAKDFFSDGLVKTATRAFNPLIDMARRSMGGSGFGRLGLGLVRGVIDRVLGFFKPLEDKLGKGTARGLSWARSQEGKPYIWGGVGPGGYDCSGFMSAITNVIKGRSPYSRLFTTFSFTGAKDGPQGFVRGLGSQFRLGITNAGVGHMAGTLRGVNVESRGSAGVVVGPSARGADNGLFGMQYGMRFGTGGIVDAADFRPTLFDDGGWLMPGLTTVLNGTRRPEAVLTDAQLAALTSGASGGAVEYHAHFDGMTRAAYEQQVRAGIQAEAVLAAQRDRTGRRR